LKDTPNPTSEHATRHVFSHASALANHHIRETRGHPKAGTIAWLEEIRGKILNHFIFSASRPVGQIISEQLIQAHFRHLA